MTDQSTSGLRTSYFPADTSQPVDDLTAGELLRRRAEDSTDVVALVEIVPPGSASLTHAARTDRTWTYGELYDEAVWCAGWLAERYQPGERIVVWAPNVPEWVVLQYGAALAGLILVTANPGLRTDELTFVLDQSGAVALFHVDEYRGSDMTAIATAAIEAAQLDPARHSMTDWATTIGRWRGNPTLPPVAPTDAAQIQYTSGTTGTPKGALLHHRGLVTNARYIFQRGGMRRNARLVSVMPLFHTAGCGMGVLGAAQTASTLYLVQQYDPELLLRTLQDHQGEAVVGVPTFYAGMLAHPDFEKYDMTSVSLMIGGGASVPAEMVRRVERGFGCRFSSVFGQTELSPILTQVAPEDSDDIKANTTGRPLWNVEVKIADPATGEPVPIGADGEICARGYQQMIGYYNRPEATAETIDADGWLHTGDLGTMDENGYVAVTGRLKDMIIRGGENIYPAEIEQLLFAHPAVLEAAVVGHPDEYWGETVSAVLRLRESPATSAAELHAYCRAHLAPHKTPSAWYTTTEFPMTGSGKLQKYRIQEAVTSGRYQPLP